MRRIFGIAICLFSITSGFAEYAIIGGYGTNEAYSAIVSISGTASQLSPIPTGSGGQIACVSINNSGLALICGELSTAPISYAAFVSPTGTLTPISVPSDGNMTSVAINESGFGIIGGQLMGAGPAYGALISPTGGLTPLTGAFLSSPTSAILSVAINDSGAAIIGGQDLTGFINPAYAAVVSPSGVATLLTGITFLGSNGIIESVSINNAGIGIIGGENYTSGAPYAAIVDPSGAAPPISSIPALGIMHSVSINDSGKAIIGGRDFSGTFPAYAAFVTSNTATPITNASLPAVGEIKSVAISDNGAAIIGGQDLAASTPYAAMIFPSGNATVLSTFSGTGIINSVAINDVGAAIIGGEDTALSRPYAALVSPSGIVTSISPLLSSGSILSVDIALGGTIPESIGPYTSVMNNVLAASFSLENHIMVHHKKYRLKERKKEQEELSLLADANFEQTIAQECCIQQPSFSLWIEPFYDTLRQEKQKTIPTFTNQIAGVIAALDYLPADNIVVGGGLAYAYNYAHYSENLGKAKINQEMAVFYSSFQWDWVFLNATLWGGIYQLENDRRTLGFITSKGKTDGWVLSPHLELSFPFTTNCWFTVEPFGMVDWANDWQKHFTETGDAGFNLILKNQYASLLRSEAGLRFYEVFQYNCGELFLIEKASYINQAPFHFNATSTVFVGSPTSFSVATGSTNVQNLAGVEMHISFVPTEFKYPYASLDFQGEFGSSFQSYYVGMEIGRRF